MNGTSNYLVTGAVTIGAGSEIAFLGAMYALSIAQTGGASPIITLYGSSNDPRLTIVSNTALTQNNSGNATAEIASVTILDSAVTFYGGVSSNGTTSTSYISVDNVPVISSSVSTALTVASGEQVYIGVFANNAKGYAEIVWPEIIFLNTIPTTTQVTEYTQYLNDTYGVTTPPTVSYITPVSASTGAAPLRITGTGFLPNVSVYIGTYACTTTDNTTTVIDGYAPSIPAGTYDLTISNVDGRSITYNNFVTVTSAVSAWSIFGSNCVGWWGNQFTQSGGAVSAWLDLSGMGNNLIQATSTKQPTYHSGIGDGTFNNQPYMTFNGTSDYLSCAPANVANNTLTALYMLAVVGPGTSTSLGAVFSAESQYMMAIDSLKPAIWNATYGTLDYGTNVTGIKNIVASVPPGASPTISINMSNGTATTATTTLGAMPLAGANYFVGSRVGTSMYNNAPIATVVITNGATSGQLAAWESYCQSMFGAA
jgi:hypothetical protein